MPAEAWRRHVFFDDARNFVRWERSGVKCFACRKFRLLTV